MKFRSSNLPPWSTTRKEITGKEHEKHENLIFQVLRCQEFQTQVSTQESVAVFMSSAEGNSTQQFLESLWIFQNIFEVPLKAVRTLLP